LYLAQWHNFPMLPALLKKRRYSLRFFTRLELVGLNFNTHRWLRLVALGVLSGVFYVLCPNCNNYVAKPYRRLEIVSLALNSLSVMFAIHNLR
jgi:hypothetical protein